MTVRASAWLPPGAASQRIDQALEELIRQWSHHWIDRGGVNMSGSLTRIGDARWAPAAAEWRVLGCGIALGVPANAAVALGAAMLALGSDGFTKADRTILGQLGEQALADLQARLLQWLKLASGTQWSVLAAPRHRDGPIHTVEIEGLRDGTKLRLELTSELFVRQLKAALPPAPKPAPLAEGRQALAGLSVALSAALGRCRLTLAELADLAPGDVIILDQSTDGPLPLAVDRVPAKRGTCVLIEQQGALSLRVLQPVSG